MELCVHLKVCEGCGCLWYRAQQQASIYCKECVERLREFPAPESRRRRGRPPRSTLSKVWAVAVCAGGGR
jgi:hypothetical protein